jgi:hypothetical protein
MNVGGGIVRDRDREEGAEGIFAENGREHNLLRGRA